MGVKFDTVKLFSSWRSVVIVLVNSFLLSFMAFYNRFPLVFSDTGTYIRSGFKLVVPFDRPIFYGVFIKISSLSTSLFLTVFVQGLLLSLAIHLLFKYYVKDISKRYISELAFVVLISFFTGASINVSQLIPDVFTPITLIAFLLILLRTDLSRKDLVVCIVLFVVGVVCHNAHFVMITGGLVILSLLFSIRKTRNLMPFLNVKKLVVLWVGIIVINLSAASFQNTIGGQFTASPGGHVFLMSRLLDLNIAQDYFNENCDENNYKICEYKDKIPADFLWNWESPLYKTGGWHANEKEYKSIIFGALTTPKYLGRFIVRTVESGIAQFFCFDAGGTPVQREDSAPYIEVNKYFHSNLKEYLHSRQAFSALNFDFINACQKIIFAISMLFGVVLLLFGKADGLKLLMLSIFLMLILNAFVSGGLSIVSERYQSRVFWMLLFPMVFYIANINWKFHLNRKSD
jgi:hypothetical protein